MKVKNKKLTNKDFENRDNILMMEIENLKKFIEKKEATDVRPKLQKPSS